MSDTSFRIEEGTCPLLFFFLIRPIMRTYRLRYQVRGCGQLWEKLVIMANVIMFPLIA